MLLFVTFLALAPGQTGAGGVSVTHAKIDLSEEGYVLNADFDFELNQRLIDALEHGVALHFVTELRVERPRWYWFDKQVVHRRLEYRLAYHAITRSYRLNIGSLHRNFNSLADAVSTMERIRNLHVASHGMFNPDDKYEVALRFFHNTALLPKPFQLSALTNGSWDLDTGWKKWQFKPEMLDFEETTVKMTPPEEGEEKEAVPEKMVTEE